MFSKHALAVKCVASFYPVLQRLSRHKGMEYVSIFLFHEVTDNPSKFQLISGNYTSKENFEACLFWISENFDVVDLKKLRDCKRAITKPLAAITFDDSWQGQNDAIRHIVDKYNYPVHIFLNLGTVVSGLDVAASLTYYGSSTPTLLKILDKTVIEEMKTKDFLEWQGPVMSMDIVSELSKVTGVTFGNHSYHHYPASSLSIDTFKLNVQYNQRALEDLPNFELNYAFTYGRPDIDYNNEHIEVLLNLGYKQVYSADGLINKLPVNVRSSISRVNFSPADAKDSDFWWATYKSVLKNSIQGLNRRNQS